MIKIEEKPVIKFVEEYNKNATDNLKERYLKNNLEVKEYLPFIMKVTICRKIVNKTSYTQDGKNIFYDSPASYLLYVRAIVTTYTNLIVETDTFLDEYDALVSSDLLSVIMGSLIPEKEMKEFNAVYKMVKEDFNKNNYELHGFISKQMDRLKNIVDAFIDPSIFKKLEQLF